MKVFSFCTKVLSVIILSNLVKILKGLPMADTIAVGDEHAKATVAVPRPMDVPASYSWILNKNQSAAEADVPSLPTQVSQAVVVLHESPVATMAPIPMETAQPAARVDSPLPAEALNAHPKSAKPPVSSPAPGIVYLNYSIAKPSSAVFAASSPVISATKSLKSPEVIPLTQTHPEPEPTQTVGTSGPESSMWSSGCLCSSSPTSSPDGSRSGGYTSYSPSMDVSSLVDNMMTCAASSYYAGDTSSMDASAGFSSWGCGDISAPTDLRDWASFVLSPAADDSSEKEDDIGIYARGETKTYESSHGSTSHDSCSPHDSGSNSYTGSYDDSSDSEDSVSSDDSGLYSSSDSGTGSYDGSYATEGSESSDAGPSGCSDRYASGDSSSYDSSYEEDDEQSDGSGHYNSGYEPESYQKYPPTSLGAFKIMTTTACMKKIWKAEGKLFTAVIVQVYAGRQFTNIIIAETVLTFKTGTTHTRVATVVVQTATLSDFMTEWSSSRS
ncbi:hypothetical protein SeMB42_g01883 [Synchytrium endobioticum]|uniref:REJ domain-containing protein n=1 Tax=Synchytrium endobioticum TaxID=286115 RepID=A0A507CRD1_9FUNG|nr:hypothetical protein SeLEV6574_g05986 [Synchytrium endobioticum]TPX51527.1 hypothetical protein SeMB42_g01883 [Synchytrium endobioticum]